MFRANTGPPSEVQAAIATCRTAFISTAVFSLVINLLMLAGPLFMLQVYDRVLTSRSVPTPIFFMARIVAAMFTGSCGS